MTIFLDENLPRGLRRTLAPRAVTTAQQAGFAGLENGELLRAVEGGFDILLTADKNIRYQQNLAGRRIAVHRTADESMAGAAIARSANCGSGG